MSFARSLVLLLAFAVISNAISTPHVVRHRSTAATQHTPLGFARAWSAGFAAAADVREIERTSAVAPRRLRVQDPASWACSVSGPTLGPYRSCGRELSLLIMLFARSLVLLLAFAAVSNTLSTPHAVRHPAHRHALAARVAAPVPLVPRSRGRLGCVPTFSHPYKGPRSFRRLRTVSFAKRRNTERCRQHSSSVPPLLLPVVVNVVNIAPAPTKPLALRSTAASPTRRYRVLHASSTILQQLEARTSVSARTFASEEIDLLNYTVTVCSLFPWGVKVYLCNHRQ
jgi:hypothetical protein